MGQEARINSVLVLKQLRASLSTFAETAATALEEASTEIQHTRQWLEQDRHRYWKTQVQARTERFVRTKSALKQKEVFDRTLGGSPSSCVDERKALKIAEARLREAELKLSRVKAWSLRIEKELADYRGATQRLSSALEVDIPNARAKLNNMIDSLEAYLALSPPEMPRGAPEESGCAPVRLGEAPASDLADDQPSPSEHSEEDAEALREARPAPRGKDATDPERETT